MTSIQKENWDHLCLVVQQETRMALKSSLFKDERKKSVFIWFALNLNGIFFFYFSNPYLAKYLNLKTQNQPLIGIMRRQQLL